MFAPISVARERTINMVQDAATSSVIEMNGEKGRDVRPYPMADDKPSAALCPLLPIFRPTRRTDHPAPFPVEKLSRVESDDCTRGAASDAAFASSCVS